MSAVSVAASVSTAKKVPARKETVPFRVHAPVGLVAEQVLPRSAAQRVTIIPSTWATKAAANAALSGNVSLTRIVSVIGVDGARLEGGWTASASWACLAHPSEWPWRTTT